MITWRVAAPAFLLATTMLAPDAQACMPMPPEPRLEGESDAAYKTRTDTLLRERQAAWFKERQTDDLQRAAIIFVARDTDWWPTPKPRYRNGRPLPPVVPMLHYPAPSYFKPIDWFRGPKSTGLFKLTPDNTSCGPMGVGDTTWSQTGNLFVFFAKKWPATGDTLIDAIAVDKIDDPVLLPFVAKYRKNP